MIGRIRNRRTFEALRASGIRIRRGPLSMTYLDDAPHGECRLGFAIPRRTGTAVVRNRVRRRIRAIFHELIRDEHGLVPGGSILVGAGPGVADRSHDQLREDVRRLLGDLRIALDRSP